MFRKVFIFGCLTVFCLGTVCGCAKPAPETKPAVGEEKAAPSDTKSEAQAPPNVSE